MKKELKEYIQKWFVKAEHDLIAAKTLLEYNPLVLDVVCFHCQQAVEKYLKAYLVFKEKDIERTHNLNFLQTQCSEFDSDFSKFDFNVLGEFAVDIRYPDDYLIPELAEAKEYLIIAEHLKELVTRKINL